MPLVCFKARVFACSDNLGRQVPALTLPCLMRTIRHA